MSISRSASIAFVITLSLVATARADRPRSEGGFWCWTHEDGETARCAPREDYCELLIEGFNQVSARFHEPITRTACVWQQTAWELRSKRSARVPVFPTKALCKRGLERGERCKAVSKPAARHE